MAKKATLNGSSDEIEGRRRAIDQLLSFVDRLLNLLVTHYSLPPDDVKALLPGWVSNPAHLSSIFYLLRSEMFHANGEAANAAKYSALCNQGALHPLLRKKVDLQLIMCLLETRELGSAALALVNFLLRDIADHPLGELSPNAALLQRKEEVAFLEESDLVLLGFVLFLHTLQSETAPRKDLLLKLYQYSWAAFREDAEALLAGVTQADPLRTENFTGDLFS